VNAALLWSHRKIVWVTWLIAALLLARWVDGSSDEPARVRRALLIASMTR
jgi:hypothetical protein